MATLLSTTMKRQLESALRNRNLADELWTWLNLLVGAGGTQVDLIFDAASQLTISAGGAVTVTQAAHKIETNGGGATDDLDTIAGMAAEEIIILRPYNAAHTVVVRDTSVSGGNILTPGQQSISLAEANDWVMLASDGTNATVIAFRCQALAGGGVGRALASTATGLGASLLGMEDAGGYYDTGNVEAGLQEIWFDLGAVTAGNGLSRVGIQDAGNYYTAAQGEAALQELFASALGGTNSTTRAYSGGVTQEPVDNSTLTAALAAEMLTRRTEVSNLLLDETSPPTIAAGRGLVISGGVVAQQGVPDLTVIVPVSTQINSAGRLTNSLGNAALGGFVVPLVGGQTVIDIVVIDTTGTPQLRVGVEGAPGLAPALTAGDVPLAWVLLTNGDVSVQTANITDCRNLVAPIDGGKVDALTLRAPVDATIVGGLLTFPTAVGHITVRGAGGVADDLDNLAGLEDGQIAVLHCGNVGEAITVRDFTVGGGNIWTPGGVSFVLATLADSALVVRHGAMYAVAPLRLTAGAPASEALASAHIFVGNAAGHAADVAVTGDIAISNAGLVGARHGARYTWPVLGAWAVDGDGAETNGGGLVGQVPVLTNAAATYAKVCDDNGGAPQYANLSESNTTLPAIYTANFQLFPDAEAIGDYVAFGAAVPFCEIALDMSATVGVYANDSCVWEYSQGGGVWAAIAVLYDNTDTTAQDGLRPFQRDGAITFSPPAAWATDTLDGQLGYWIRSRVTAAQITTAAISNAEEHSIVTGEQGWRPPHNGTITAVTFNDNAAVLHTTADVIVVIQDETTGASVTLTFAMDRRSQRVATTLAVTTASRLSAHVVQEDGAAEPTGVVLELEMTLTA